MLIVRQQSAGTVHFPVIQQSHGGEKPPKKTPDRGLPMGSAADIVPGTNYKSCKTQKETTCMLTGPDTTSILGDDALVHASQAHDPLPGTKPPPTGAGLSGQQNTDTPDVSTHAALHV
jgi:hypothetical protein